MIHIKSKNEINIMRKAGEILSEIENKAMLFVKPGVSTEDLDEYVKRLCEEYEVIPAFLGYRGYSAVGCYGVNDTVVHGLPSKDEVLKEGDIISIDIGVIYKEFHSDRAVTIGIGEVSKNAKKLMNATKDSLYAGIKQVSEGNYIGDIGFAMQSVAELAGFSVVKQMVGHGVGKSLHEDPQVPGYGTPGTGVELKEGMTIAIEAIINEGEGSVNFLEDGWTTKTVDGKLSALYEHTVLVKKTGYEILSK